MDLPVDHSTQLCLPTALHIAECSLEALGPWTSCHVSCLANSQFRPRPTFSLVLSLHNTEGKKTTSPCGRALFQLSSLVWLPMTTDPYSHPRPVDFSFLQATPDLFFSPRFQIQPLSLQQTYTCFTENVYTRKNSLNFPPSTSKFPFTSFSLILEGGQEWRFFFASVSPTFLLHLHSPHCHDLFFPFKTTH